MTAKCGNKTDSVIFFQSIFGSPEYHGKGGADSHGAFHSDFSLNNINYSFDQSQTEPVPLRCMGGIALIKFFENMSTDFGSHSASRIGDLNGCVPFVCRQGKRNGSIVFGEFKSV